MKYELFIVDSLSADGPGSFAEAMRFNKEDVTRIVVFDVAGVINLNRDNCGLDFEPRNVVVKGETAPGKGISIRSYPYYLRNSQNITLQGLHFHLTTDPRRRGNSWSPLRIITDEGKQSRDVVIRKCTFTGGEDEQISCTPTVQWKWQTETPDIPHIVGLTITNCRFNPAYTLNRGNHNFACMISLAEDVKFTKNFIMHANRRSPQIQGANVLIDQNVIYNYGSMAIGCMAPGDYTVTNNVVVMGMNSRVSKLTAPISIQGNLTTGPVFISHGGNARTRFKSLPYALDLPIDNQTDNPLVESTISGIAIDPQVGWDVVHKSGATLDELDNWLIDQYKVGLGAWARTEWAHNGFPEYPEVRESYLVRKGIAP